MQPLRQTAVTPCTIFHHHHKQQLHNDHPRFFLNVHFYSSSTKHTAVPKDPAGNSHNSGFVADVTNGFDSLSSYFYGTKHTIPNTHLVISKLRLCRRRYQRVRLPVLLPKSFG